MAENQPAAILGRKYQTQPGSLRNSRLNYSPDDKAFAGESVPAKALDARRRIQNILDPNILGLKQADWNLSVSSDSARFPEHALMRDLHKGVPLLNRNDREWSSQSRRERLLPLSRYFMDTEDLSRRTDADKNWNQSNVVDQRALSSSFNALNERSCQHTMRFGHTQLRDYKDPMQRETDFMTYLRERKAADAAYVELLKKTYGPYWLEYLEMQAKIQAKPPRQTLSLNHRVEKVRVYSHTGRWEISPTEKKEAWSCCASTSRDNPGCTFTLIKPEAWNYAGITS